MKAVEVVHLSYRYADGHTALQNVHFSVEEGSRVALIGPNGAGKSTLLQHLNGLLPEDSRHPFAVSIFGVPISKDQVDEIRSQVGLLFQDPDDQLFCPTVFEDVAFGPSQREMTEEDISSLVSRALSQVGLDGFENRLPHHLSHGEKRRVCLAGVLACRPKILVLDEPTRDLDPRGRRELKSLLARLPITQIIATHDLELVVELCTHAILMDQGRLVAQGVPTELLADEKLMLAHGLEKPHILHHSHPALKTLPQ